MRIAIIGSHDLIMGFKALGVETFNVQNKIEVENALERIKQENNFGIVFITEDFMDKAQKKLLEFQGEALPAIVPVPCHIKTGAGLNNLKRIVERAVGSDILFK